MLPPGEREELRRLIAARSFRTGRFTLASGRTSTRYFNLKPTMMHPRGAALAARALLAIARRCDAAHVSGLAMGAVPVIGAMAALSAIDGAPLATGFVRKEEKGHGTRSRVEGLAEGESLAGVRTLVVDDVATSGGSAFEAARALRAAGARVAHAAVIVNRGEGADALLAEQGIALHAVFTADEIASDA